MSFPRACARNPAPRSRATVMSASSPEPKLTSLTQLLIAILITINPGEQKISHCVSEWLSYYMPGSSSAASSPSAGGSMAINASKVVVAGIVAGIVANVVGVVAFGMLLGPRVEAEAVAVAPLLAGRGMSSTAIATNVLASFVTGMLLVWL